MFQDLDFQTGVFLLASGIFVALIIIAAILGPTILRVLGH